MSNHLAIATVTATLRRALQIVLDTEVPALGAQVTTARPNAPASDLPTSGINLFLFQVTPNPGQRNTDLPTRRGDGSLVRRPTAAVDLHYLLGFYGDDSRLEPQIILGCTVRALHAGPALSSVAIAETLADPTFSFVASSDLASALDRVRFTPSGLSLEETSKLWSVFFQTPYVLSMTYQAGVVLIEHDVPVQAPLPVRSAGLVSMPLRRPVIAAVVSRSSPSAPMAPRQPILAGHTLVLRGKDLGGTGTSVEIDGVTAPTTSVSDTEITLAVPAALRAGAHGVQVVQRMALGEPAVPHGATTSNVSSFVLSPTIAASSTAAAVSVTFDPPVGKRQRARLLLSQLQAPAGAQARSYAFEAPARDLPGAPEDVEELDIPIADVAGGVYLVRAQVDGAESPLSFDASAGRYDGPTVEVP